MTDSFTPFFLIACCVCARCHIMYYGKPSVGMYECVSKKNADSDGNEHTPAQLLCELT